MMRLRRGVRLQALSHRPHLRVERFTSLKSLVLRFPLDLNSGHFGSLNLGIFIYNLPVLVTIRPPGQCFVPVTK